MAAIMEALRGNMHLYYLYMDDTQIGDVGGICLGDVLNRSNRLHILSLKNSDIGDEGASRIA
jgi:hypothetical protein